jgi:heme-degrading monooxygenase HmoA
MFARMTILQVVPENYDDAIKLFRRSVVPEAKKQKGYRGACLLSDPKSGKGIVVTFWRNEADAVANEESRYYQEQLVKSLQYLSGPPIREGYMVNVHAMRAQRPSNAHSGTSPVGSPHKVGPRSAMLAYGRPLRRRKKQDKKTR